MEQQSLHSDVPEQFSLCVRVRAQLPDYIEGYLDVVAAEAVRAHLAVCMLCNREYREMRATIRLVETLPFMEPGHDYAAAIRTAIEGQAPRPWWRRRWRPPRD